MRQAGYDATGLEVSHWVVEYARRNFDVPVLQGTLEQQALEPESFDILVLMDVLEHLPDPLGTFQVGVRLLKPGGFFLVQTPCYPAPASFQELSDRNDPFLAMLIPGEHLYLFSKPGITNFFQQLGLQVTFEPAVFQQYDQFVVAGQQPMPAHTQEEVEQSLTQSGNQRIILALLDLYQHAQKYIQLYQQADTDRRLRLERLEEVDRTLGQVESDRAARLIEIEQLNQLLRDARAEMRTNWETWQAQNQELAGLLEKAEQDRAANQKTIEASQELTAARQKLLDASQKQIAALESAIAGLRKSPSYRILRRLGQVVRFEAALPGMPAARAGQESPARSSLPAKAAQVKEIKRIIVDLTPVRPGGENGGAKPLALDLIRRLSRDVAPQVEFILFTSSDVHEELAWLDRPNVSRMCVNQVAVTPAPAAAAPPAPPKSLPKRFTKRVAEILERVLPVPIYRQIYRLYHRQVKAPAIHNLVRSLKADLVFCPFTGIHYFAPEIPVVVIVHDLQHLYYPEFFSPEQRYHTHRNLLQVCQVAARIVCVSDYTRQTVLEWGKVEPDRLLTIPSTIFTPLSIQPAEKVAGTLARYQLTAGEYLFYPANFWAHKNHALLLTAFNLYCHKHPASLLRLVFTGAPGQRMQLLQKAVQAMNLAEKVIFAGFVEANSLAGLFQGSLAVIFPSLFEGFGAPVLEGMFFQKPVLCSSTTSLPELGGDAVLYFDPRRPEEIIQAIEEIATDPELARELSSKGPPRAAQFLDADLWARQYFNVFEGACQTQTVYRYSLNGVFPDGWAGNNLEISVSDDERMRQLELKLEIPPWAAKSQLTLKFERGPLQEPQAFVLGRGKTHQLSIPILPESGIIEASIDPTISPKDAGINEDTRQVSCMVLSCQVISGDQVLDVTRNI